MTKKLFKNHVQLYYDYTVLTVNYITYYRGFEK